MQQGGQLTEIRRRRIGHRHVMHDAAHSRWRKRRWWSRRGADPRSTPPPRSAAPIPYRRAHLPLGDRTG
jgi:hypothetical protein